VKSLVRKSGKHKRKNTFSQYESEIEALEQYLPPEQKKPKKKGKHKVKKDERLPMWVSPEDIPEEEEMDWLERQRKQYEKEVEDLKKMGETGKRVAIGTYKTVEGAVKSAKRFGKKTKSFFSALKRKFGKHRIKEPPVQVFIEPNEEGDYVVYGQTKRTEIQFKRPKKPIDIKVPPLRREEYVVYGE